MFQNLVVLSPQPWCPDVTKVGFPYSTTFWGDYSAGKVATNCLNLSSHWDVSLSGWNSAGDPQVVIPQFPAGFGRLHCRCWGICLGSWEVGLVAGSCEANSYHIYKQIIRPTNRKVWWGAWILKKNFCLCHSIPRLETTQHYIELHHFNKFTAGKWKSQRSINNNSHLHSPFSSHQLCDCCLECSWLGHDSVWMPICAMGQVNIKSSFCRVSISILQKRHL